MVTSGGGAGMYRGHHDVALQCLLYSVQYADVCKETLRMAENLICSINLKAATPRVGTETLQVGCHTSAIDRRRLHRGK